MLPRVRLPFGYSHEEQRIKHVSEVPSGLRCECACTGCGAPLVARKGKSNAHHFAHHRADDCGLAFESALHQYAKELISEELRLFLPEVRVEYDRESECISEAGIITFDSVKAEQAMGSIRPDIIASKAGHDLVVEIAVTHFCDEEKIKHLNERGISAVEIDLSGLSWDASKDVWRAAILMDAPRVWLSNSRIGEARKKLKARQEEEREAARRQAEKDRKAKRLKMQRQADTLIRAFGAHYKPTFIPSHFKRDDEDVVRAGFDGIVGEKIPGDECFAAEAKVWQSCLVSSFVVLAIKRDQYATMFSTKTVHQWLVKKGFIRREFASFIDEAIVKTVRKNHPEFHPPYDVVHSYLGYLRKMDVLTYYRGRWHLNWSVKQEFRNADLF